MVVAVAIAIAGGAVAAAGALWFVLRKALGRVKDEEPPQQWGGPVPPEMLPVYDKCRPLGQMEYIQKNLHDKQRAIITFAMSLKNNKPTSEAVIKQALGRLAKVNPLLRMKFGFDKESKIPLFEPMENFKVQFKSSDEKDWKQILCNEVDNSFDDKGPLWRVIHLPTDGDHEPESTEEGEIARSILIMTFHRSIMDEPTVAELTVTFLRFLNEEMKGEVEETDTYPLLPSLDVHYTAQHMESYWYEGMTKMLQAPPNESKVENIGEIGSVIPNDADLKTNDSNNNDDKEEQGTELITEIVDEEVSTQFVNKCMEYGLSVGAAIEVAAVIALTRSDMVPDKLENGVPVMIEQVIPLKPALGGLIPPNYCGNYSVDNVVDTIVPKTPEFVKLFWTIANDVNNSMGSNITSALPVLYVPPPMSPEEVEQQQNLSEKEPADKNTNFSTDITPEPATPEKTGEQTNLEPLDDKDYGKMRVSALGLIGKSSNDKIVELAALHGIVAFRKSYGPGINFLLSVVESRICLSVSYKKEQYNQNQVKKMVKTATDLIEQVISFDPPGATMTISQNESESQA